MIFFSIKCNKYSYNKGIFPIHDGPFRISKKHNCKTK